MDIALATHQPPRSSPSPSGQQDTPSNTLLSPSSASSSSASMTAMSSLSSPTSSTTVAQSATSSSSTSSSTPSMWSASNEDPHLFATLPQQRMPRPPVLPRLAESGEGSTAHYAHAFTSQPPPASSQPQPQHYHHLQQHQQHQHQFQQHQPPHHHHHDDMEGDEDEEEDEYDEENRSDTSDTNEHRPHEVEFWLQRCSICFDARLDFCLEHCRDQYVKEVVNNSWGLNVTKIKCPVCQDIIPQSEWEKYVDAPTLALYRQFNQPYRSFSRYCDDCGHEVVVSSVNQSLLEGRIRHPNNLINPLVVALQRILALAGYATAFTPNVQGGTRKFKNTQMAQMNEAKELLERFHIGCKRVFEHTGLSASRLPRVAQSYLTSFARSSGFSLLSPSTHPSNSSQPSDATQPEGVLEIYRDVMSGVLDLLNLHLEDEHPSLGKRLRRDVDPKEIETDYLSDDESVTSEDDMYAHQESQTSNSLPMSEPQVASDHDTSNVEPSGLPLVVTFTLSPEKGYRPLPKALNVMTRSQRKRRAEILRALVKFSKELISLETRQEQWKELQFLHVRWLRWDWCGNCEREVCLQCGEGTHHEPHTCYEYMKRISENHSIDTLNSRKSKRLKRSRDSTTATTATTGSAGKGKAIVSSDSQDDQDGDDMSAKTMRWKLLNTNPCPNCCILIHRDDGCNKVDCLLCGYRFCWLCRETWGSECGFFRCKRQKNNPDASASDSVMSESVTSTSGPSTENRTKSSEDIVPALGITDLSGDVGSRSPATPEQTIVLSQHPKVMDKPEIGVPNVYVIQAKRSRK
ncbi:Ankyrin repeat and IBR domain-containing protein 1 [Actinomortierella wolfii]|nr:Ankyrin repeat and IBR domain-containing protein 1 [Actinomortierella wolfii]